MSKLATDKHLHEIAVIGLACRFPGAKSVEEFWHNLQDGVECISFFSDEELLGSGIEASLLSNPNYVKANAILEDIELFDAAFFGYNPREAEIMDPQHRFFLEVAWEALERAGYDSNRYKGLIGVFGGVGKNYYLLNNLLPTSGVLESVGAIQTSLTNDKDFLPANVSYKLNLRGPSMNVQTACSTSLVAIHLACQSLLNGECDMALAGGVSITELEKQGYLYHKEGIYSSDGHCRAFDAKAEGTVGGNGVGIVVLKRLVDALEDGDQIHAVVKGSAVNNDGSLKVGFSAPSVDGQSQVIAEALAVADVDPETVTFVETHGTATALGDPIEVAALTQAFRSGTQATGFCALGAVKSNLGHTNAAAGVAGFIKAVLALKHREIPPTLHFEKPNPKIDFENSPFFVNSKLLKWKPGSRPRRAGVSSFGMGGTNAHLVLEEAPPLRSSGKSHPFQLLLLSAKTKTALEIVTTNLVNELRSYSKLNLADVAYTLQVGRRDFAHRRMLVCRDIDEAVKAFQSKDTKSVFTAFQEHGERSLALMFPGQGAQHVNMGKDLYDHEPEFRKIVDQCCELLEPDLDVDLRDILYPEDEDAEAAAERLKQTAVTQPALFVIEYALARLWMSWGVRPQAMIGHSIGEYVAACLAGVFSLEDALALVAERGRLMQSMPPGSMLAVSRAASEVVPLLNGRLSLAAANAPALCVVSGPGEEVDEFAEQLANQGMECRRLHTSHAFHSEMMDAILAPFVERVAAVEFSPPRIPFVSNVTGTWITAEQATEPNYWAQHLRQGVKFADGAEELLKEPGRLMLEVGPGRTLTTLASLCLMQTKQQQKESASHQTIISSMRRPNENQSDVKVLLNALGQLWLAGVEIDWCGFYANEKRHRVLLPTYPFERHRYWIEPKEQISSEANGRAPLQKKPDIGEWFYVPSWKRSVISKFSEAKIQKCRWLVFLDECGVGSELLKCLGKLGHEVSVVTKGIEFYNQGTRHYQINPRKLDDYNRLLNELKINKDPITILHLWNVDSDQVPQSESLENSFDLGFNSLLLLARALGERDFSSPLCINVIANGLQEVIGDEALQPHKSTILGPCRVIPQELPDITCRSIDIVLSNDESRQAKVVEQLINEIHSEPSDNVVAYRGGHRWVQNFEPLYLDNHGSPTQLRKGGVYLVTGGFGGIGLALSEYLAQTVRAKLILTGRKGLPQRTEWEQWLVEHDETDDTSRKIRKVRELEALGAEVLVAGADVSNLQQMKEVIKRANQRFGRIHGLIHSAGVAGGGMIQLKSLEAAEQVLAPKVKGTQVLELLFKDTELDFMVLCSSLAATIGGIGQIDYCGANAFLDAFALHASRNGRIMVSISWDTWQEVGMAVNTEVPDELKAQRDEALKKGMTTREGMDVFSRILQSSQPHVLVSTSDLRRRIEKQSDQWETPADQEGAEDSATSEPMHARPGLSTEYVAPRSEIEKNVARIWQRLFGIEQIGVHDDFFELGGHSLLATQLLNKLRKSYDQAELSLRNFFENATVAGVTELIQKTETKGGLLQTFLNTHSTKERKNLVENYLKEKVTQNLKMRPDKISVNDSLIDHGLDSITPDLIWELKRDFGLRVYPFEILKNPSIKNLTDFVSTEVDRMDKLQELYATSAPPNFDTGKTTKRRVKRASQKPAEKKNKGIIFLLSAPRSGSTLLRLMLSGHPALFCPPELGLLAFDTVQAWSHNQLATFSKEGAIRNLMVCTGLDYDKCHELLNGASQKQKSIQQVYSLIQDHAGTRILVDKTPGYAMNIDTLERAEALFEKPKYICLIRHPYPVIDSFVRNRFEKLFGEEEVDPFWFAEKVWATCNHNIRDFFERIDAKCCYKVRYETLVSEPEKVMRSVCEFLNLEFEEPVLHPYEQGEMLAGPGDPDILQHDKIDASLGDIWKKIKLPRRLSDFSQRLAAEFGYDLPQEDDALTAESKKVDPSHARKLLENLDGLSDDEVNALLSEMLTSEEKRNV